MKHTVYSSNEIKRLSNPLEDGAANYEVIEAKCTTSASGNPMVELKLRIWDKNGKVGLIKDWIVLTTNWAEKFRNFWLSCKREDIYKSGETSDTDYLSQKGKCEIKWVESKNEKYPDSMKILNYLVDSVNHNDYLAVEFFGKESENTISSNDMNDDLPF